ncbi:MAG: hypothetical protein Q9218_002870 [Villophora microphyllina]
MAANIPAALKSADISRFALRAGQLDKAKPSIGYWCTLGTFTKTEHSNDDTIIDDMAAQVYVEQFALETFQRAENAMRANKSSRQTADTLAAAVVFLELRQIWEPLDAETSSKVKYAKYHALRIAKAIKAGEDPNMSNPAPEPPPQQQPLDLQDPDVQMLDGTPPQPPAYQPSVEDVPDEHDSLQRHLAQRSSTDQSLHPSRAPSVPRHSNQHPGVPPETPSITNAAENYYHQATVPDVSPLQSPDRGRNGSIGGGYFPTTPAAGQAQDQAPQTNGNLDDLGYQSTPNLPDIPSSPPLAPFLPPTEPLPPSESLPRYPPNNAHRADVPAPSASLAPQTPQEPSGAPAPLPRYPQPSAPSAMTQPGSAYAHQAMPMPCISHQHTAPPAVVDEEAMAKAQKHARFAISALNFEDVNTAITELRGALESLGAR